MKTCILLSGLQRNFEPFIENQLKCVIDKYGLDVFIFTSDENVNRVSSSGFLNIDYITRTKYDNDVQFFYGKYKNLKGIHIDYDNNKFNEFIGKSGIKKHRNHTLNMISSYFKFNECIKLMEEYENNNNFKYDMVLRCRLDFFAFNDFLNLDIVDKNVIYLPICKISKHKDDSGILMNRNCVDYVKQFIDIIIKFNDAPAYIIIENEFHNYLNKKYKIRFVENLSYRIGVGGKVTDIPYYDSCAKDKIVSLEYPQVLQ